MIMFKDVFIDDTKNGKKIPKEEYLTEGLYPIIDQGQEYIAGYSNDKSGIYENVPVIIFGDHTRIVKYVNVPFFLGADGVKVLKIKGKDVNHKYFYYALSNARIPDTGYNRHFKWLKELNFNSVNKEKQDVVVEVLDKLDSLIKIRKQQLQKLDELIKARFVEVFGDPILNPHGYEKVALSELADIKIGPFGSLLHKEDYTENGHPLVNPSHIIEGKVLPDNKLTVSSEKYDELSAYRLKVGDVVMGRRGEMGRCAVVDCDGYLCGTGSLLIRTKGEVTADYIQKSISFPSFKKSIEDMAVGQTMPNLNVPIVSKLQLIKPPIEVQNDYYEFVAKIDKSKLRVQKSLNKLEILKKALMQKYFG